jgi:hypothetical protein
LLRFFLICRIPSVDLSADFLHLLLLLHSPQLNDIFLQIIQVNHIFMDGNIPHRDA